MTTTATRTIVALLAMFLASLGFGGTLSITSLSDGDYLGRTNSVRYTVADGTNRVTIRAVITYPDSRTRNVQTTVDPDSEGNGSGSISIPFESSAPEGAYTIAFSATETDNTYNSVTRNVFVDVVAPKFVELSPNTGSYANGIVRVRASVEESNIDEWTVTANGEDFSNNTGATNTISVDWDPSYLTTDGAQTLRIVVKDRAGNEASKTITVNVDRVRPSVQIVYPSATTKIRNGQDVTVLVDITDTSSSSVDKTGIDVILKRTDGAYIARVTLISLKSTNGTTQRYTGRVKFRRNLFPANLVISARVIDRAGNIANVQEITVRYGN